MDFCCVIDKSHERFKPKTFGPPPPGRGGGVDTRYELLGEAHDLKPSAELKALEASFRHPKKTQVGIRGAAAVK